MPARVLPWLLVLLAGLLYVAPARADVQLRVPADWAKQGFLDPSATTRANEWAKALGGQLSRAESSANVDQFVETLAVISLPHPTDSDALQSDEAARRYLDELMAPLVGDAEARDITRQAMPGDLPVVSIRGYYLVGGTRLQAVVVPEGTSTSLVLVGSLESEYILYGPILSDILASIEGGSPPVVPFDVGPFRTTYLIGWLVAFLASFFGSIALFSDRQGDYKRTGSFAAAFIAGLSVLAAIITYIAMGDAAAGLEAVGSSVRDLAGEVFGVGVLGALIIFGVSQLLESDSGPVQSAPTASTIVSAAPGGLVPPPSHAPDDDESADDAVHLIEDAPEKASARDEAATIPKAAAKRPAMPPPPSSRVPPPVSSTARRVKSSPMKAGAPAKLEDARTDPSPSIKRPSHATAKTPKK